MTSEELQAKIFHMVLNENTAAITKKLIWEEIHMIKRGH